MEAYLVIGLLVLAILLFASEKLPVDVITIGLLLILVITGLITPDEAFLGFSSDFMVILASIFVITGALNETGVLDKVGSYLVKIVRKNKWLFLINMMIITALLSAFMNNTTVTALVIGPAIAMSRKLKMLPSKVLIPIAFASMLGGTCTLIGTSTNVAVSGYIKQQGMEPLGFFEILPIGIILTVVGIIYILIFSKWLLPSRETKSFTEGYEIRQYLTEIYIAKNSKLIGQRVFDSDLAKSNVNIVRLLRNKENMIPVRSSVIEPEDVLLVECNIDELMKMKERQGIEILGDVITDTELQTNKIKLAEVLITPNSALINKSLKESRFRLNFDVIVLAVHRFNENLAMKIGDIKLKTGDLLLMQGHKDNIDALRNSPDFTVLGDFRVNMFKERKGIFTALFFIAAVLLGSLKVIPLSIAFLSASLMTVLIGAISTEKLYQVIDWRLLILIAGMSAFGIAMEKTGASVLLAEKIIKLVSGFGPNAVLAAFCVLVVLLTQPLSNAAAALVVLPVALQAAEMMNANPREFAVCIMLCASISFITPFEPSCILVYGPGKYKFIDFIKIGLPLTIILVIIILMVTPYYWPMKATLP